MTKARAPIIPGLTKTCPSCGAEIQGKKNIYDNVFFMCQSDVDLETGNAVDEKTGLKCKYRENYGIVASQVIRKQFEGVTA